MARTSATQARERIVDAATCRFARQGYDSTSLSDIAADMGCSKAAVLYHFHAKAAILRTLMEPPAEALRELVDSLNALDVDQAAAGAARGFIDVVLHWRRELMSYPAGLRSIRAIPELDELQLEATGERLIAHLSRGVDDLSARVRAFTFLNGIAAAAKDLSDAPTADMHQSMVELASDIFDLGLAPD